MAREWTQDEIDDQIFSDDGDDDDSFVEMSCGRTSSGGCQNEGTEYCDWTCPFAGELRRNRIRHMKKDARQTEIDL